MLQNQLSPHSLYQAVLAVKQKSPLVHNITNMVVMPIVANILLAIGASPIMAHAEEELESIVNIAQSLVLNIGTLDANWLASMHIAQQYALARNIPIILDPVGAGASALRTSSAKNILDRGVTVLRGNASEILALSDNRYLAKGVDSMHQSEMAIDAAIALAKQYQCCVVISGKQDIICFNDVMISLAHGTPLLTRLTGMGCSATALIGAFIATVNDPLLGSTYAMATLGIAAEKAEQSAAGPGTFYPVLLDVLYSLHLADFANFKATLLPK